MARTPGATRWKLAIAALGAALLGAAAFDLWRVLWQDELWRLPRGWVLAALGGASIGIALQWAHQSANAALIAGSAALCVVGAVLAQPMLGLDDERDAVAGHGVDRVDVLAECRLDDANAIGRRHRGRCQRCTQFRERVGRLVRGRALALLRPPAADRGQFGALRTQRARLSAARL